MQRTAVALVACALVAAMFVPTSSSAERPPPRNDNGALGTYLYGVQSDGVDEQQGVDAVVDWLDCCGAAWNAEQARLVEEYLAAVHDAEVRASMSRVARPVSGAAPPSTGSGDCSPIADIIGWGIVNRESGGVWDKWNTQGSGAFGCAQTLITHYNKGGVCYGDDPYTIIGQTACVQTLYDRGGLNPWALTR